MFASTGATPTRVGAEGGGLYYDVPVALIDTVIAGNRPIQCSCP
jgi:hypothetical protein